MLPDLDPEEDREDSAKLKAILVFAGTIAFVVSPFLTEPFTGFNPEQLPNPVDDPMIQPAGYAFSIWGVIYLWLLASAGFGLFKRDTDAGWDRGRWPLFVSVGVGASWIAVALMAPVMATALIWVMFLGAVLACLQAPRSEQGWNALPLGLYAGWLTAASSVALSTVVMGWGVGSETVISWLGLGLALALAVWLTGRLNVVTYPIAVAWALIGVVVANLSAAPIFALAAGAAACGLLWMAYGLVRRA